MNPPVGMICDPTLRLGDQALHTTHRTWRRPRAVRLSPPVCQQRLATRNRRSQQRERPLRPQDPEDVSTAFVLPVSLSDRSVMLVSARFPKVHKVALENLSLRLSASPVRDPRNRVHRKHEGYAAGSSSLPASTTASRTAHCSSSASFVVRATLFMG